MNRYRNLSIDQVICSCLFKIPSQNHEIPSHRPNSKSRLVIKTQGPKKFFYIQIVILYPLQAKLFCINKKLKNVNKIGFMNRIIFVSIVIYF
jgi:hypothetical protein